MKRFVHLIMLWICTLYGFQEKEKIKPIEHEVKVELVLIEVFVTDKRRNFVEDLTENDIEIYEDGRKVKIQYFNQVKPVKKTDRKRAKSASTDPDVA